MLDQPATDHKVLQNLSLVYTLATAVPSPPGGAQATIRTAAEDRLFLPGKSWGTTSSILDIPVLLDRNGLTPIYEARQCL